MDFLAKAYAQLLDLFRSMTVGARIVAGLLLAVIVISVAFLFNHTVSGSDEYLMNGETFTPSQINSMMAAFGKANLATPEVDGPRIRVPRGQQAAYMGALADANALPKNFGDYVQSAVGEMNGLMPISRQKEMMKVALEHELALVVGSMRGIESAEVLYDSEIPSGLNDKAVVTATVSVKTSTNEPLDNERVQTIRRVVAGAISGLKPNDVVVADLDTGANYAGATDGSPASGLEDPYGADKRMYEQEWESKIRGALSFIPGVIVKANVELNPELALEEQDTKIDKTPTAIDIQETSSNTNSQSPAPSGRPGLASQGGVNTGAAISNSVSIGPKTEDEKTTSRTKNAVGTSTIVNKRAPLTPRRVTVTVAVLRSYYAKVWAEKNPGKTPDEQAINTTEDEVNAKLTDFVKQLIPIPPTESGAPKEITPLVKVMSFQQLAQAPIQPPSIAEKGLSWLGQYWTTLGTLALGLVSLIVLRSMVRSIPAPETSRPTPAAVAAAPTQPAEIERASAEEVQEAVAKLKRRVKSGPSMRDELVEIVREDPDAAANILRNWIGSAT